MDGRHYDAKKLVVARELRAMTQQQVAAEINVDKITIYRIEQGLSASYESLLALCEFYQIPIKALLHDAPAKSTTVS